MNNRGIVHVVCIKERIFKQGEMFWKYTPVFESSVKTVSMMVAKGAKKYHRHVVVESKGDGFYAETSV